MLLLLLLSVFALVDALTYYTNSSLSIATSATGSSQDLAGGVTVSPTPENTTSTSTSFPSWNPIGFYNTKSYWVGETTKQYPIHHEVVTAPPNGTKQAQSLTSVMQCWSSIETWRNESASFRNNNIANRTWSVTSFWSTTLATFSRSSTIYPTDVSTYKLGDGTPRVNARPKTTSWNGNSTLSGTYTKTLTPTFREQPCSLSPYDCRLLYQDTDVKVKNENELLNQCGNPAHLDGAPQCLLGGGPVELVYFPVENSNSSLGKNRSSGAFTAKPMMPGLSEITTLGHTFTSDSVYLSFKTLFATYDGFWDRVGPNFTDLIVPLHSSDVSTQCGGWGAAYGAGTALNYADLNWPVPASAYSCQDRCSMSYISSVSLFRPLNSIGWLLETVAPPEQCNTIWSDVNPVLAVPTKIRQMVPEWSACAFWNKNIANFWFDPPIALQPAAVAAKPTAPSSPESTPAAAASTPTSPAAPNTSTGSAPTTIVPTSMSSQQTHPSSTIEAPSGAQSYDSVPASPGPDDTQATSIQATVVDHAPSTVQDQDQEPPPSATTSIVAPVSLPPALSVLTEALSTYYSTEAAETAQMSEHDSEGLPGVQTSMITAPTIGDIVASVIGLSSKVQPTSENTDHAGFSQSSKEVAEPSRSAGDTPGASEPAFSYDPITSGSLEAINEPHSTAHSAAVDSPLPTLLPGDLTFTISDQSTAVQTVIVDSHAITDNGLATIFGHTITRGEGGMAMLTGPSNTAPGTQPSTLLAGDITLTASAAPSQTNAIVINDSTLSIGGPAVIIGGNTITHGSDGILLVSSDTIISFTALPTPTSSGDQTIWALGSVTLTASSDPHYVKGILVDGTSLSYVTGTIVVDGATITAGSGALQISGTDMTEVSVPTSSAGSNSVMSSKSLPSVILGATTNPSQSAYEPTASATTASSATSSKTSVSLQIILLAIFITLFGTIT